MARQANRCIDCDGPTEPGTCFCTACSARNRHWAKQVTDMMNDAGIPPGVVEYDPSPEEETDP